MSILDELYYGLYIEKVPVSAEYKEIQARWYTSWDKAAETLGPEFSDKVWNTLIELKTYESQYNFKEGFRLGVQLMLEACFLPGESEAVR